jgi:hypothetical protein
MRCLYPTDYGPPDPGFDPSSVKSRASSYIALFTQISITAHGIPPTKPLVSSFLISASLTPT